MKHHSNFNFASLRSGDVIHAITDPESLFDALPNKARGFGYLRQVQAQILNHWYPRRDERDLVIKANTGGGKTIVGLLILQSSLHESVGSALYVAPDSHLAAQVIQEAEALGLTAVEDPDDTSFIRGEAICVTTIQVLLNGKSRFGVLGAGNRHPVPIGTVIIDDAHAAVTKVDEAFRLVIPRSHATYQELLNIFEESLKQQGTNTYLDIVEEDPGVVQRVPFWDWQKAQDEILRTLRPYRHEEHFEWSWPIIADQLELCEVTVSSNEIEIKPPCPPIQKFPSFSEAKRRVYMTATLPDDSILATHFDADPRSLSSSIVPDSASDLGDRLVLAPQEINPEITRESIRRIAKSVARDWNVVVLAPSWKIAREWEDIATALVSKPNDIEAEVERLRLGNHSGIVVIVNRYDGIDLPDDACRLLVIDSLPFALSNSERRESAALRDSEAMVSRQVQRLEQGMGRAVRSRDDRCAVILTGPRLTQLISRPDAYEKFSTATKAQLELSRKVARELGSASTGEVEGIIHQVIQGDTQFRALSRETLMGVTYGPAKVSKTATHVRAAYNAAYAQNFSEAAVQAKHAVDAAVASGDTAMAGWLEEMQAAYVNRVSETEAQTVLAQAITKNSVVLKPLSGISYETLNEVTDQATQALEYLTSRYKTGSDLIVGFEAVVSDIEWDNEKTEQTEAALAELGSHLGFLSQRPEKDYKLGSDVLWSLGDRRYAVIEAKTGATASLIWKKDINQLAGSVNWCQRAYGRDAVVIPVMVHVSRTVHDAGTPPANCRSIDRDSLKQLKEKVRSFARALAHNENYRHLSQLRAELVAHKFDAHQIFDEYSIATTKS